MAETANRGLGKHRFFSTRKREALFWAILLGAILIGLLWLKPWRRFGENLPLSFLAGNPHRGASLFASYGCNSCHSLFGAGPGIGPDLSKPPTGNWNPVKLVADLWSHSPAMWEKMREAQFGIPHIAEYDMLDLLTFLYLIRYVDQPGDAAKGRALFTSKHCAGCHFSSETSQSVGPDLAKLGGDTPIVWAQRMWNHGRAMKEAMSEKNLVWPTFRNGEMIDLLTYVQQISSGRRQESELFPADPVKGKRIFRDKGCIACHTINGEGGKGGPDLGSQHRVPPSLTEFAGLMWNHSPKMMERMDQNVMARAQFAEREMADLIAYLYVVRYLEPAGRVDAGKEVFNKKHCANCHGSDGHGSRLAPSLAGRMEYLSPMMAYTVWSHGPTMYQKMKDKNIPWPTLDETELVDLMAFLNSL